jgi:hypothetical protein
MLEWIIASPDTVRSMKRFLLQLSSLVVVGAVLYSAGCGFSLIQPTPPNAIPDFDFDALEEIQRDERLTVDERREAIRTAIGAPMSPEGDRIVDFLLGLNLP